VFTKASAFVTEMSKIRGFCWDGLVPQKWTYQLCLSLLQKMDIRDKGERMARSPEGVEGCQEEHEGYLPRKRSRTQLGLFVEAV